MESTARKIEERLRAAFSPSRLEIADETTRHRGHPGARDGGGHFSVLIVSPIFSGQSRLERHRAVYGALEGLLPGEVHAIALRTLSPEE